MSGTNGETGAVVDVAQLQAQLAEANRQIELLTNRMNAQPVPPDEIPAETDRSLMTLLGRLLQQQQDMMRSQIDRTRHSSSSNPFDDDLADAKGRGGKLTERKGFAKVP